MATRYPLFAASCRLCSLTGWRKRDRVTAESDTDGLRSNWPCWLSLDRIHLCPSFMEPSVLETQDETFCRLVQGDDAQGVRRTFESRRPDAALGILRSEIHDGIPLVDSGSRRTVERRPCASLRMQQRPPCVDVDQRDLDQ